jgi:hypothetical protein
MVELNKRKQTSGLVCTPEEFRKHWLHITGWLKQGDHYIAALQRDFDRLHHLRSAEAKSVPARRAALQVSCPGHHVPLVVVGNPY